MENSKPSVSLHTTCGEVLRGAVVELVLAGTGDRVDLLYWDGSESTIGQQLDRDGVIYEAPYVHQSVIRATNFPRGLADYGKPSELFWRVTTLFRRHMGISPEAAAYLAYVVICSWFPERDPGPITLYITGDLRQVLRLFRLLHALCRRPLVVAELSRRLPFFLCPTLLLNLPSMSAKAGAFWRASNFPGVYVHDVNGVSNIAGTRIVFCESADSWETWGPEAMHFSLLPVTGELPSLTQSEADTLAAEYLPQLLMLRLRVLVPKDPAGDASDSNSSGPTGCAVGRHLPLFLQAEPEIVEAVTPLLEAHEQELLARRSRDPEAAIVEVLWPAAHKEREVATTQITKQLNALLVSRAEIFEFDPREVGWKLRVLGLDRHHNRHNRVLRFDREMRRRVHELAARFGLKVLKVAGCADCEDPQLIVP